MVNSYGNIASSKAIIDQKTGECKGYGFTMFENPDDCERAIDGLNKAGLQASFARVGQVRKKGEEKITVFFCQPKKKKTIELIFEYDVFI